ncbi:MAG: tetratricopeptide repeat protein [Planctomycetota bacterium]
MPRLDERPDLVHLEARCLTMLDRTTEAHRRYLELTRMAPENASAWIEFGTLAWKLGDYRRVAQCSVRAINTAPERFEGYMLQGLFERHEGRLEKAIELFRKASERSSDSILPHLLLGKALEQNGEMHGAAEAYTAALEVSPGHNDAIALLQGLANSIATGDEAIATGEDGRPENE